MASAEHSSYSTAMLALIVGIFISVVGVYITGFLAAVYIPKEFFEFIGNHAVAAYLIHFMQSLLCPGLLLIAAGYFLAKRSGRRLLTAFGLYFGFMLYPLFNGDLSTFFSYQLNAFGAIFFLVSALSAFLPFYLFKARSSNPVVS